jgi:cell division protein ZapE
MLKRIYEDIIKERGYLADYTQISLLDLLSKYQQKIEKRSLIVMLKRRFGIIGKTQKQGVYIYGEVGRGKTFVANLFFQSLNTKRKYKQHFHQFMLDCHSKINKLNNNASNNADAVEHIAKEIAKNYSALYLDEFQVNNIVDAMLLSRLFMILINRGVYIFITSNAKPSEIYNNGLKREYILPFIDFIQGHLDVYYLDNPKDYRKEKLKEHQNLFIYPFQDSENQEKLSMIITDLIGENKFTRNKVQVTENRFINVANSYGKVAKFTFDEICVGNLGPADYIALCKHFGVIVIARIPQLRFENHNEVLRFITLVDCMYDHKMIGVFSAEVKVDNLYLGEIHRNEFNRTISRIYEMQSSEYISNSSEITA